MPDTENHDFIREKIMDQATGRHYRIRRFFKLVASGVVFGLVAAVVFVLGLKYLPIDLVPAGTEEVQETISVGRDAEVEPETDPEPSLEGMTDPDNEETEEETGEEETEEEPSSEEESSESPWETLLDIIGRAAQSAVDEEFDARSDDLALAWYSHVNSLMKDINRGLVTIGIVTQDTDWFNNQVSTADQTSGAIFYITDAEVLILADYEEVRSAQALSVTFSNGRTADARIKKADTVTGLAVVSVSSGAVSEDTLSAIRTLTLGNSYVLTAGTPVVVAGSPNGFAGSVATGMISLVQKNTVGTDTAFQLLYLDASVSDSGGGFLFNTSGDLVGYLSSRYGDSDTEQPVAIGISSLKGIIDSLSSGIDAAYLGIQGQNVTTDIAQTYEIPVTGIYVTKVIMDSPAYLAGVKAGDILVGANDTDLVTTQGLQRFLEDYSTGDVITLTVYRSSQDEYTEMTFSVTLGAR